MVKLKIAITAPAITLKTSNLHGSKQQIDIPTEIKNEKSTAFNWRIRGRFLL